MCGFRTSVPATGRLFVRISHLSFPSGSHMRFSHIRTCNRPPVRADSPSEFAGRISHEVFAHLSHRLASGCADSSPELAAQNSDVTFAHPQHSFTSGCANSPSESARRISGEVFARPPAAPPAAPPPPPHNLRAGMQALAYNAGKGRGAASAFGPAPHGRTRSRLTRLKVGQGRDRECDDIEQSRCRHVQPARQGRDSGCDIADVPEP